MRDWIVSPLLALLAAAAAFGQTPKPLVTPQGASAFVIQPGQSVTLSVQVASRTSTPQSGATVYFVAPSSSPSGQFTGAGSSMPWLLSAQTNAAGVATGVFTATDPGLYLVTAALKNSPALATFAFTVLPQPPTPALSASAARAGVKSQILLNAVEDETLRLHGPFLLPAGSEALPDVTGPSQFYRQSIPIRTLSWLFWIDDAPQVGFGHSTRFVVVDATQTDGVQAANLAGISSELWWPDAYLPDATARYSLVAPVQPGPSAAALKTPAFRTDDAIAPNNTCAIIITGPNLDGSTFDALGFSEFLTDHSLVKSTNIMMNQSPGENGNTDITAVNQTQITQFLKNLPAGCTKVYVMISAHGVESDGQTPGIQFVRDQANPSGIIPYDNLHNIFAPLQGKQIVWYENSCFAGQVVEGLQGWGLTGEIVTASDFSHTAYTDGAAGSYFFSSFLTHLWDAQNGALVPNATALQNTTGTGSSANVTAPGPAVTPIAAAGTRHMSIPTVIVANSGGKRAVLIERPPDVPVTSTFVVTITGPAFGTLSTTTVTLNPNVRFATINVTGTSTGSSQWSVTGVDQTNKQNYAGHNIFQVGQLGAPDITVPVNGSGTETVARFGANLDRGDTLNAAQQNDTSATFTVKSNDTTIATPGVSTIRLGRAMPTFTFTVNGVKAGTTTFTVTNPQNNASVTFTVNVVAAPPPHTSNVSCPDSALFDSTAMIVDNPAMHPISPGTGKWMFTRTGSNFILTGPQSLVATGTIDLTTCNFSGSGPYQIFGFNTTVDVMKGFFVMLPSGSDVTPGRAASVGASSYAGMQFNYAIGDDGHLPTGQAISFQVQGVLLCSYALTPSSLSFTAGGGSGLASVTTDIACPWSPAASATWITPGAPAPNSSRGPGSFSFKVAPNTTAARTGNITVAGAFNIAISQDAGNPNRPAIDSAGVVDGAGFNSGFTSNEWVTITGTNLAATQRTWAAGDFKGSLLPTQLDGTSVTINGNPAFVYFISSQQLNVLSPADTSTGPINVQVTTPNGRSDFVTATRYAVDPALFLFNSVPGRYAAAVHGDGVYVGASDLFGAAVATRPAAAGEEIQLFGTGGGDTNPTVNPASIPATVALMTLPVVARVGGVRAHVDFAGLVSPGLYQFNITIPQVPPGDQRVEIYVNGQPIEDDVFVTVGSQ